MMQPIFDEIEGVESLIVQPMLFSYLDFAAKKLMEEGRASTEMEGAAIALLEIMEFALDDEYIDIDSLIKAGEVMAEAIMNLCT